MIKNNKVIQSILVVALKLSFETIKDRIRITKLVLLLPGL